LAGATAKRNGAVVASIANVPVSLMMGLLSYLHYTGGRASEDSRTLGIVLPASVLGSIFFSAFGGLKGERWQKQTFPSETIFGIRPIHWWWLIFPLGLLIQTLPANGVSIFVSLVGSTQVMKVRTAAAMFLVFVAFATSTYFIAWGWYKSYRLLSTPRQTERRTCRTTLAVLFYLFVIPVFFQGSCALVCCCLQWLVES
jgi:hypothetical protein